jgi:phosphatidylglycerophosphate synthase
VRPIWLVWPGLTLVVLAPTAAIAWWSESAEGAKWIAFGIATSAATSLASWITVARSGIGNDPWGRLVAETAIRMALPLGALLAVALVERDAVNSETLAYFLPFQLVTLVAGVNRSLVAVKQIPNESS